jgi:hypothetical protein
MRVYSILLLASAVAVSCNVPNVPKEEAYGTYAAVDYVKTTDTIWLQPEGRYERHVYAANGPLLLDMKGSWHKVGPQEFQFSSFFLNLDRDLEEFPELLSDTLGGISVILENDGFCTGYLQGENCYRRLGLSR